MARVDKCNNCFVVLSPMFAPDEIVYIEIDKKNNISEVAVCLDCASEIERK